MQLFSRVARDARFEAPTGLDARRKPRGSADLPNYVTLLTLNQDSHLMDLIHHILDLVFHLKANLNSFAGAHQIGVYALLGIIVFCETGLVVAPFLPGDTMLFAVGALAATTGSTINLPLAMFVLCAAANCGDLLNYTIGFRAGPKVFSKQGSWLLNKKHLNEAQQFYERHGRKTIVMARFIPIIRTFAPFVAGIGKMPLSRFIGFSIAGGMLWVTVICMAGYLFGNIPWVDKHFEVVVVAIMVISASPVVYHSLQRRNAGEADVVIAGSDPTK
jgi:membrane-associated protein